MSRPQRGVGRWVSQTGHTFGSLRRTTVAADVNRAIRVLACRGAQRWRADAERAVAWAEGAEPEAVRLRARVVELEGQVEALTEKVAELTRRA